MTAKKTTPKKQAFVAAQVKKEERHPEATCPNPSCECNKFIYGQNDVKEVDGINIVFCPHCGTAC